MHEAQLILIAAAFFVYALVSRRLANTILTGPLVFLALGFALSGFEQGGPSATRALFVVAEATLVAVLFADAAHVDWRTLVRHGRWAARMLAIGLPLAMALGILAGLALLPHWRFWDLAVLAAILAPTDAALGQAVVTHPAVPERIRSSLTTESGLNDGLTLPAVLFFASIAVGQGSDLARDDWLAFAALQVLIGAAVGAALGLVGAIALNRAWRSDAVEREIEGVGALALAGACYLAAEAADGNGFIATFVGGVAFGAAAGERAGFAREFLDGQGRLLILASFLLIGIFLLPAGIGHVGGREVAFGLVSLFLVRPAAIWLSLLGTDAPPTARLFLGWFGPRGLATALFALLVVDHDAQPAAKDILAVAVVTLAMSALLHGVTAAPAVRRFGRRLSGHAPPLASPSTPDA